MFSRLTFLGTGAGMPSPSRNVSGLALTFQDGSAWLFDCGEGTQHQLMRACGPQGQAVARALGSEPPAGLTISRLRRVFISHLHGDHCLGLPGLVLTLASMRARSEAGAEGGGGGSGGEPAGGAGADEAAAPPCSSPAAPAPFAEDAQYLEIVGPVGLARMLRAALVGTEAGHLGFQYRVTELADCDGGAAAAAAGAAEGGGCGGAPGAPQPQPPQPPPPPEQLQASEAPPLTLLPDASGLYRLGTTAAGVSVCGAKLQHRVLCFGYAVTEPARAGALDAALAQALGARGAQLGALKAGRTVALAGGGSVAPAQCVAPAQPGRTALILGDSLDNSSDAAAPCALLRLPCARGCAVLVHEATFCDAQAAHALPKGHATARQAAAFAAELGAERLVLTHLSQRYAPRSAGAEAAAGIEAIEAEAREELALRGAAGCSVRVVEDFEVCLLLRR